MNGLFSLTERETCFVATYYRAALDVHSLVVLNDPKHFEAIAQLARTLFELAVDMRLLGVVDRGADKMMAFSDLERLKSARELVELGDADAETSLAAAFIRDRETTITARKGGLWPNGGRLNHWSGMDLPTRVKSLRAPFDEMHKAHYRRLSWYVHPGLAGVVNFEAAAFEAVAGMALQVAAECYEDILRALISEIQLSKVVEDIYKRLEFARVLAFADNAEQAEALRREMLS